MQSSAKKHKHSGLLRLVPALLTLLVILVTASPVKWVGMGDVAPALLFVSVFYWCVYLPASMPYLFLFFAGLLQDSLAGTPLGMTSLLLVLFAYLIESQRGLMGRAVFGTVWGAFALLLLLTTLVQWGMMCVYFNTAYSLHAPSMRWFASSAVYPAIHLMLTFIYKQIHKV